ncbi:polysaccharide lyase 8 family protein [Metabacillus sp. GX 13764]|uniref:polysaccharide lyase 8 family protein n=1 Tax=Metabacillus kandeliae TaxID=2900151 RepID=UPI001E2D23AF|nr:polysaccharide lyase 8 family protein [Metabacillus kandeliae]MCD7035095.1 polysaccharide lyase 8 family protein [Metabacillus kandeliae]
MNQYPKKLIASSLAITALLSFPLHPANVKASEPTNSYDTTQKAVTELDQLKANFTQYLAGNDQLNNNPLLQSKISAVQKTAATRLAALLPLESREGSLFKNLPLGSDESNLSNSYLYLYQIALAAKTSVKPGSTPNFYGNQEAVHQVIDSLDWLYNHYFKDQEKGYYGNWYAWEIGMPMNITKTLLLLEDEIKSYKPDLINAYIDSMDKYLRNGKNGDIDLASRFHRGSNLADIATDRILQGAITGDEARVSKAVDNLLTVFQTVDPNHLVNDNTDGFYRDGSFVQHKSVAYTGSYGKVLLNRIIQTMVILNGTSFDPKELLTSTVKEWVTKGFAPVIFEGYMMEIVKGRAVSRTGTGYQDVYSIVESLVDLSRNLGSSDALKMKSYIKYLVSGMKSSFSTGNFSSLSAIADLDQILKDPLIPAENLAVGDQYAFNMMDKNVQLRDSYSFAFSRSSDRISKYEYMSGENLLPWFQSDGAYYLYLAGRDQTKQYGANYFATVNPLKIPGTTVPVEMRKSVPELYGKPYYENTTPPWDFYSSSESENKYVYFPVATNTYSGGAKLGKYGAAGIQLGDEISYPDKLNGLLPDDFVTYKNAEGNKSAFMFDKEIVLMGSGISDKLGREVRTTLENRMFGSDEKSTVTGGTYDQQSLADPSDGSYLLKWMNFKTDAAGTQVGYYFPEKAPIAVAKTAVSQSLQKIRTSNPNTTVSRNYFSLSADHGTNPKNAKYAVVLLPNLSEEQTKEYAKKPEIKILANTKNVQAVENKALGLKGMNFFSAKKTEAGGVTSYNQASVLVKEEQGTVTVAVSDPTLRLDKMLLEIELPSPQVLSHSREAKTYVMGSKVIMFINSESHDGKSYEIKLKSQ